MLGRFSLSCSSGTAFNPDATAGSDAEVIGGEVEILPEDVGNGCENDEDCQDMEGKGVCQVAQCDSVAKVCILGKLKDFTPCNDDDLCTVETYCLVGECGNGFTVTCDDQNACTDDACDPEEGCIFKPNTAVCDDGNACTSEDACNGGVCSGAPTGCPCDTDDDCLQPDPGNLCVVQTSACIASQCVVVGEDKVVCDESLDTDCSKNACDPATGVCGQKAAEDGLACTDGFACTIGDACQGGLCASGENKCPCAKDEECAGFDDQDMCNGLVACIDGLCAVNPDTVVHCPADALTQCKVSKCDPATGTCGVENMAEGVSCNDEDLCTFPDKCKAGECTGAPADCNDGEQCTDDSCDPATGCVNAPISDVECNDGDECTEGEQCDDGACTGGAWICDDCGNGTCDEGENCGNCIEDCAPCGGVCCTSGEVPGCEDKTIEECTCALDPYCCETAWDNLCISEATESCGLVCQMCGDGTCGEGETCELCPDDCGNCEGCGDGACDDVETCETCPQDCPCGADPCEPSDKPGCDGCAAEECVCGADPYCCQVAWDQWCVGTYSQYCGGECEGYCGDGFCDEALLEDCTNCIKDCGPCTVDCGNNVCDLGEDCSSCEADCGKCPVCGDGECVPPESCQNCEVDCGKCGTCGDGSCSGTEDCGNCPADCGACEGSCVPTGTLACGASSSNDLAKAGATDNVISYSCNEFGYQGPEYTYTYKASCDGIATVTLSNETSATDVMVLSEEGAGCDPSECIGYGFNSVSFDVVAGGVYYVVVDGYNGASGKYTIALACECGAQCGNGLCEEGEDCVNCAADCGECSGDCCSVHDSTGCDKPAVEACVCAMDPFCCEFYWDGLCVKEAAEDCGDDCPAVCGDGICKSPAEDCASCEVDCGKCPVVLCTADEPAGCGIAVKGSNAAEPNDVSAYACNAKVYDGGEKVYAFAAPCDGPVTAQIAGETGLTDLLVLKAVNGQCQPASCETWGVSIVSLDAFAGDVFYFVVDSPAGKGGDFTFAITCQCGVGDCCQPKGTPGCEDQAVRNCVCALDPFCCDVAWDSICVNEAQSDCGLSCSGIEKCGDSLCTAGEDCQTCPQDCGECCGNAQCQPELGEDCKTCPADCGACPHEGSCCMATGSVGCKDPAVEQCVCAMDPFCCNVQWDGICAAEADECGSCTGDCCAAHDLPGCDDEGIEACVCKADPYCCGNSWDSLCAGEVESLGCGSCGGATCGDATCNGAETCATCPDDCGPCCGNGDCEVQYGEDCNTCSTDCGACPGQGSCCVPNSSPGCKDTTVQDCVCGMDPYCCSNQWDPICAGEADLCGSCNGNCCAAHSNPGCDDENAEECVCKIDPFCCNVQWDDICAAEVESQQCGTCGGEMCGDGECSGTETCETCPMDCGDCCGDGTCDAGIGEDCATCPTDCGSCSGQCSPMYTLGCEKADSWSTAGGSTKVSSYTCVGGNYTAPEYVYSFTAACDGEVTVTLKKAAGVDGYLDLFALDATVGCKGEACVDYAWMSTDAATMQFLGVKGHAYYIVVDGYNGASGDYDISVKCACTGCGDGVCSSGETCVTCTGDCGACQETCCAAHSSVGCSNAQVQACVCGMDPYCCNSQWDGQCASEADQCGSCTGDCCLSHGNPGCDLEDVEACVCKSDSFCCNVQWDSICADEVEGLGCGSCGKAFCGDGACNGDENCSTCPDDCGQCCGNGQCESAYGETCSTCAVDCGVCPTTESCCTAHAGTGCKTPAVQSCVCAMDLYCCDTQWDGQCAAEADQCGSCNGDCCAAHGNPGCDDEKVESCVCKSDPFCCNNTWDSMCATGVTSLGCGACNVVVCGDGKCNGTEDCSNCPWDCGDCCGDGECEGNKGETCYSCDDDCGACPDTNSCCLPHAKPGCASAAVQACVCKIDQFCCNNSWDDFCAAEADDCGTCNGDCCAAHGNPGCVDEAVEKCVCPQDPYCCEFQWDGLCAQEVTGLGCGACFP